MRWQIKVTLAIPTQNKTILIQNIYLQTQINTICLLFEVIHKFDVAGVDDSLLDLTITV